MASPELVEARTEVDEVVIDTTYRVPLEILSRDYPFKNFRYPFADAAGRVLFVGNDPFRYNPAKWNNGVYESLPDGTLRALATQDMIVAGDGEPVGPILGLRTDFSSFIFHRGANRAKSLMGSIRGGTLQELVSLRTPPPRSATPFAYFLYGDISDRWMVFFATTNEDPWIYGLYHLDVDTGKLLCLIQSTDFLARFSARLGNFSWQPDLSPSHLVFGAHRYNPAGTELLPGRGILGWSVDPSAGQPERQLAVERLEVLAPFGMEIPESGGLSLHWANNPVTDGGLVAVVGGHDAADPFSQKPGYQTVLLRTADGQWHNPIDTHTLVPGQEKLGTLTSFNPWMAIREEKVIFLARGPDAYEAMYIYDPADRSLTFVIDTLRAIEERRPIGFEISTHCLTGQRLTFMARFEDGTSAILRATLPGLKIHLRRASHEPPAS